MSTHLKFEVNNVRGMTAIGIAKFPKIIKPDTNYGGYKVDLLFPDTDPKALAFQAQIEKFYNEGLAEARKLLKLKDAKLNKDGTIKTPEESIKTADLPVKIDRDKEREPTGKLLFRFKCNESIKQKDGSVKAIRPRVFDAQGKPWDMSKDIGGGSEIRVRYAMHRFYSPATGYGVKMYLDEVQVVKLRVYEQGFDAVEDGIDSPDAGDGATSGFGVADGGDAPTESTPSGPVDTTTKASDF